MTKKRLGRGLEALIPLDTSDAEGVVEVKINKIRPNQFQPRRSFDEEKLGELAESIREHGVIQPIVIRKKGEVYEIVAGERRWRASQRVGLTSIPAVIKEYDDTEMMQIALIENLQREDLNPIEEAMAYRQLMDEFNFTQEMLSQKIGKSRSVIANSVRLLTLPEELQQMISNSLLSSGHARALVAIGDPEKQLKMAREIINNGLTVRDVEKKAKEEQKAVKIRFKSSRGLKESPFVLEVEEKLKRSLGTKVKIKSGPKKGKIEIEFYNDTDLDRIVGTILNK
jgi:ParB family chromosome partitioning protein